MNVCVCRPAGADAGHAAETSAPSGDRNDGDGRRVDADLAAARHCASGADDGQDWARRAWDRRSLVAVGYNHRTVVCRLGPAHACRRRQKSSTQSRCFLLLSRAEGRNLSTLICRLLVRKALQIRF